MTDKRKTLLDFNSFTSQNTEIQSNSVESTNSTEDSDVTHLTHRNDEQSTETLTNNSNTEYSNVVIKSTSTNDHENVIGVAKEFDANFVQSKKTRQTVDMTHTRQTYLIRNDLIDRLERLAKKRDRGFKTHLINFALGEVLDELEKKN